MPKMFLNGTAMSGQKDHGAHGGSVFLGPARTAGKYRFFAVRDEFPGLFPVPSGGRSIVGELYDIPEDVLRDHLLPSEPQELEFGEIELEDGEVVNAMILVPARLAPGDKVVDIAELGGFRAYQAFLASNARLPDILGIPRP
jgi:gamma-glutamylcyclotransferase (GGCT)/AIG2-like uncharacterized protein YtfP